MKNNTANNTVEFVSNEEMSNYVSDAKQLPLSTIRKALADAQISYTSNAARPTYMQHMINTGVWTVAETVAPIQTEEKENEPMDNVHNESPANDADLTDTTANVAPIDTNSDEPIVQVAQSNELDEVLGTPIDTNLPANESAPMTKSEALEFLKEYEAHANTYANAYNVANATFDTVLKYGATSEDKRDITVAGLVAASGITAVNVDAYLSEKFANKKIGQATYTGTDTVLIARQVAESEFERMQRLIGSFKFSMQDELNKLCAYLFSEVAILTNGKVGIENITIEVKTGKVGIINPIAPPATTKRANKTVANEGETKKRASYKVKDGLSVLKTGKDWEIHITTSGDTFCFACHKEGQPDAMITGEFSNRDGISFPEAANKAYQNVTSDKSRVSVLAWLPSSCFIFEETTN